MPTSVVSVLRSGDDARRSAFQHRARSDAAVRGTVQTQHVELLGRGDQHLGGQRDGIRA